MAASITAVLALSILVAAVSEAVAVPATIHQLYRHAHNSSHAKCREYRHGTTHMGHTFRRCVDDGNSVALGNADGEYYCALQLGPQTFNVVVDTGSSIFAVEGSNCVACTTNAACTKHSGKPCTARTKWHPSSTSSLVDCRAATGSASWALSYQCTSNDDEVTCGGFSQPECECTVLPGDSKPQALITQCYADGSGWQGPLVQDQLSFGGYTADVYAVAKALNIKDGEQSAPFSGIIGMAYGSLSGIPTPFEHLVEQTGMRNVFTMCLRGTSGTMVLGGGDRGGSARQWTPLLQETYYVVNMTDMLVDGGSIGVPSHIYNDGETIVDSGTTDLSIPHSAYLAVYKALQGMCSAGRNLVGVCGYTLSSGLFGGYEFQMSSADIAAFPTFTITLAPDVRLAMPPQLYITPSGGGYASLGMSDQGDDTSGTILGANFMQGFQVVFDRAYRRVGFGPASNCDDVAK